VPESPSQPPGTLLEYLRVVRRRGWVIVLTVVLAGGAGYFIAKRAVPVYQAQASVLLQGPTAADAAAGIPSGATIDIATELQVLEGYSVRQAVIRALPNAAGISSVSITSLNSFTVSSESTDAKLAAASANAYATAYIDQRRTTAVDDLLAVTQQIQTRVSALQQQIAVLGPAPAALPPPGSAGSDVAVQQAALENQLAGYRTQLNVLQLQLANVTPEALLLTPAEPSGSPAAPQPRQTAAEAGAGGLVVGIGLVFLMEYLDDTVTTTETLARLTGSHPVLGVIPTVPGWRNRDEARVTVLTAPNSQVSEAFRYLRTSVRFLRVDDAVKVIQVTSPASRDGKTTAVANLGVVLAQVGEPVVIIDLDLRRPRVHEFFDLPNDVGFTSVMLGELPLSVVIQPIAAVPGLSLLTTGPQPPNPSEVLSSARAVEMIATLRARGWTIVLDSPPVLPVTDASVISTLADATVLVASAGLTKKHHVKKAVDLLQQVRAPFVGAVLNRATLRPGEDYGYTANGAAPTPRAGPKDTKRPAPTPTTITRAPVRTSPEPVAIPTIRPSVADATNGTRVAPRRRRSS
jgi:polysaccharide biosynthesis transport protein